VIGRLVVACAVFALAAAANVQASTQLAHPKKPFSFPEWGLWGIDDPAFVKQMATFVQTHRRTKLIAYYNAKPGSIFDLASKPRSLAAYKRYIVPLA
jgi:hypothetical protein